MPTASGQSSRKVGATSRTGLRPAPTRAEREQQQQREATLANLHRAPTTAKGKGIAEDMANLMEDYYGIEPSGPQPPLQQPRQAASQGGVVSTLSRHVPLVSRVENQDSWQSGPRNQDGRIFDASDRNLLCMDVQGVQAVVGSADHGLRVFNLTNGRPVRTLFSKQFGHTEWVTGCAFLPDGRILSGGMDSKLCLWQRNAVRCQDLLGHTGSISQVSVNDNSMAVSCAYDRTLRVWDCRSHGAQLSVLSGHQNPVMQFEWVHTTLISGDRKGVMKLWDLERGESTLSFSTRGGQVGSLALSFDGGVEEQIAFVGDQSGTITAIDARSGNTAFQGTLHPGGVVSELKFTKMAGADNLLVSAGADKVVNCYDLRAGLRPLHSFKEHRDFIYSVETFANFVLSGAGNGWLLVHDVLDGKCLYGLGANAAAVRSIFASQDNILAAGDDGKAVIYDM